MARRSDRMVAIGAAVFLVGAGLVFVGVRSSGSKPSASTAPSATPTATAPAVVAQGGQTVAVPQVVLPKGLQAVAVKVEAVPALAGYVQPGDRINLYAAVKGGEDAARLEAPYAKLVLTNVRVLDVVGALDGVSGDQTYVLALDERDAEKAIFFAKFESLWVALVPDGYVPGATRGHDYGSALQGVTR